jgi:hypothetical protein
MSTVSATLFNWARRTRNSLGARAGMPSRPAPAEPAETLDDGLIYRLRQWPSLPSAIRTAEVFRLLSVMSHRAVNRRWMLAHSQLEAPQIEALLRRLVARGDVEVIDLRRLKPAA